MKRAKTPSKVKTSIQKKQKSHYKVSNWKEYDQALVNRGSITFWIDDEVLKEWEYKGPRKPGGKVVYSDLAIRTCLTLRVILHLPLRQTQGFVTSLMNLLGANVPVPDYTTLSVRSKELKISLRTSNKEIRDVVVDSTGVKVYGEGEWKVRRLGYTKRRTWRKLHLAIDPESHEIVAQLLTTNGVTDAKAADQMIEEMEEKPLRCTGDKGYDIFYFRDTLYKHGIQQCISVRDGAIKDLKQRDFLRERDQIVEAMKKKDKDTWKEKSGYHRRSLVEVAMYRYKMTFGDKLHAKKLENQQTETRVACYVLNRFLELGMPNSYKVEDDKITTTNFTVAEGYQVVES